MVLFLRPKASCPARTSLSADMLGHPLQATSVCQGSLPLREQGRRVAEVQRYIMAFRRFPARPHELGRKDTHDKSYLLADRQGPAYAEIVLVRIFRRFDWHAVWIDTYRKGVCWEGMPYESQ